jgi:predicted ATPase
MGLALRGWALAMQGQGEEGIAQIQRGLHIWQTLGVISVTPYLLTLLAEAYGSVGQPTAGQAALAEAQALVKRTGERWWEAELYRHEGEILLAQAGASPQARESRHQVEEATTCFQQALDIARQQHTRSLELRAALSLGRLWLQQGKRQAARQLLSDIYGGFAEGFHTADLEAAAAFLQELA